jgi:hypothetical protein
MPIRGIVCTCRATRLVGGADESTPLLAHDLHRGNRALLLGCYVVILISAAAPASTATAAAASSASVLLPPCQPSCMPPGAFGARATARCRRHSNGCAPATRWACPCHPAPASYHIAACCKQCARVQQHTRRVRTASKPATRSWQGSAPNKSTGIRSSTTTVLQVSCSAVQQPPQSTPEGCRDPGSLVVSGLAPFNKGNSCKGQVGCHLTRCGQAACWMSPTQACAAHWSRPDRCMQQVLMHCCSVSSACCAGEEAHRQSAVYAASTHGCAW